MGKPRQALDRGVVICLNELELVALLREADVGRLFPSETLLRKNAERVRRGTPSTREPQRSRKQQRLAMRVRGEK